MKSFFRIMILILIVMLIGTLILAFYASLMDKITMNQLLLIVASLSLASSATAGLAKILE